MQGPLATMPPFHHVTAEANRSSMRVFVQALRIVACLEVWWISCWHKCELEPIRNVQASSICLWVEYGNLVTSRPAIASIFSGSTNLCWLKKRVLQVLVSSLTVECKPKQNWLQKGGWIPRKIIQALGFWHQSRWMPMTELCLPQAHLKILEKNKWMEEGIDERTDAMTGRQLWRMHGQVNLYIDIYIYVYIDSYHATQHIKCKSVDARR